jgi:lysophospholipase L1-like esterase
VTIVALGDSTTAGTPFYESPLESPPDGKGDPRGQYAYWLMDRHPDWRVLNRGVNGERTDQIALRFDRDVVSVKPDVVVIIAGVNDVYQGRPVEHVTAGLAAMYGRAARAGIPAVAGSIVPYNTATPEQNTKMHAINDWIENTARSTANIAFVDTRRAAAALTDIDRLAASPDGLHPDIDGYRRMAEAIDVGLQRLFAVTDERC